MTVARIEQLRKVERTAIAACAAYVHLLECIEKPKLWSTFEQRTVALRERMDELLELVGGELDIAAPQPLSTAADAKQTTIEQAIALAEEP